MPEKEEQQEKPQDGLALIIGGLFVLALVFAAYNYFKQAKDNTLDSGDIVSEEITSDQEKGDLNGFGAKDEKPEAGNGSDKDAPVTLDNIQKGELDTNVTTTDTTTWVANNYSDGEIVGASYSVKTGDTLWEIAEGAYGDGTQWTKILEANKSSIGFLANGTQALIVPGQVLVLP